MITKPYIAGIIAVFLVGLPIAATQGATFLPVSEEVASLRSEAKGDVYAASNSVVITAPVEGDIFAMGDSVDISGSSTASIFAIGRTLSLTGDTKDDVRVAGSIISIGSQIAHDLFAAGSSIFLTPDSRITGDVYVAGENITISGTVDGSIQAAANKLTITKDAKITGDVTVRGNAPIIEDGATLSGKVNTIAPQESPKVAKKGLLIGSLVTSVASAGVLALLLLFAAPALVAKVKNVITTSPAQSGVIGLLWLLLCLPVTLLLLISGVGAYAGILVLTLTFPVCILAFGLMVITTGSMTYKALAKKDGNMLYDALIGAAIVAAVGLLGPIGFIALSIGFLISFGAILKAFWTIIQGK